MTDSTVLSLNDTLATVADTPGPDAVTLFGPESFTTGSYVAATVTEDIRPLTGSIGTEAVALLCMTAYILLLYRYRGHLGTLARTAVNDLSNEINFEEHNRVFSSFVICSSLLGGAVAALGIMRAVELGGWTALTAGLSGHMVLPAIMAAEVGIVSFQRALLRVSGSVTMCRTTTDRIGRIRRQTFALLAIAATPSVLMFVYSDPRPAALFGILTAAAAVAAAFLSLYKSLTLFRRQRISILNWILYLCAVEIFPVSLCVLALLRSGGGE